MPTLVFLLAMLACCARGARGAAGPVNYVEVRDRVTKAYPQQAEEMADALGVLQQLSEESAAILAKIEAACGK